MLRFSEGWIQQQRQLTTDPDRRQHFCAWVRHAWAASPYALIDGIFEGGGSLDKARLRLKERLERIQLQAVDLQFEPLTTAHFLPSSVLSSSGEDRRVPRQCRRRDDMPATTTCTWTGEEGFAPPRPGWCPSRQSDHKFRLAANLFRNRRHSRATAQLRRALPSPAGCKTLLSLQMSLRTGAVRFMGVRWSTWKLRLRAVTRIVSLPWSLSRPCLNFCEPLQHILEGQAFDDLAKACTAAGLVLASAG